MPAHPFSVERSPYGPTASSTHTYVATPSDSELTKSARALLVVGGGVVSYTDLEGSVSTFTAPAGLSIYCCVTHVLAATTATILVIE